MKTLKILGLLIFFSLNNTFCYSQYIKNWAIAPTIYYGKILKHSPKIAYQIPSSSTGISCNIIYKTYGKENWHEWQNYPGLGVNLGYFNFGNDEILGKAYSFLPNIYLRLNKSDKFSINFSVGTGIAYLSKHFSFIDNETNNAIGSYINNISSFQFDGKYKLNRHLSIAAGFGLTHFSNGASKIPNLGINLAAFSLGAVYIPLPVDRKDYIPAGELSKPKRRLGLTAHGDIAFIEQGVAGGPKYPIYIASVGVTYAFTRVNHFILGAEYENNKADYYFLLNSTEASTEAEAYKYSSRYLVFLADEFFFWPFSMVLQAGTYVDGDPKYPISKIYTKLSTRYYLPAFGQETPRLYLGIQLKAHKFTAEYISLGLGLML
ncbi:MAG TPA: acyloxyacyl hydrolase [Saprospiraceae bacterium]|nr:acyloxyacyl hydrolase [Saprospiraceae bacterium]